MGWPAASYSFRNHDRTDAGGVRAGGESRRYQFAPDNRLARGSQILRRQGPWSPIRRASGSKVPFPFQLVSGNLTVHYFDTVDQHPWLAGVDRENNPRPRPAERYLHDPRQAHVGAVINNRSKSICADSGWNSRRSRTTPSICSFPICRFRIPARHSSGSVNAWTVLEGIADLGYLRSMGKCTLLKREYEKINTLYPIARLSHCPAFSELVP